MEFANASTKNICTGGTFWILSGVVVNRQCKTNRNGDVPMVHDSFQKIDDTIFSYEVSIRKFCQENYFLLRNN
jgi:hypothetical protein